MDAVEGRTGNDALSGDAADERADVFFYDTGPATATGEDAIAAFGARDILVTTKALADNNGDGVIGFGRNLKLDLDEPDASARTVSMNTIDGGAISRLEFDGSVVRGGVEYFVYSLVGSAAGVGDLVLG